MSALKVEPFDSEAHTAGLVQALLELRAAGSAYPPARDADSTNTALGAWLKNDDTAERWVITHLGVPIGHVSVGPAHAYLLDHLASAGRIAQEGCGLAEIGKFFVDPRCAGQGAGSVLLQAALARAWTQGLQPALAVLPGSEVAMRLYGRVGMEPAGSFEGVHGTNFVFVDPGPARH